MPTAMPARMIDENFADTSTNMLRPVLLTVLSLKVAVAAFLLLSVSLSPPLSAESRYLASEPQMAAVR